MVRTTITILILGLITTGCMNKRGISATYYNDCREYYDMHGYYHKKCDKNMIEYEEIEQLYKEEEKPPTGNVW